MLHVSRILVSAPLRRLVLAVGMVGALAACGQKGDLYLPTGPGAANRATLPDTLQPWAGPASPAASAPAGTGTANPVRTP